MNELLQSFEDLSPIGLILPAVALVAGLLLWAAGHKVLKWAFAAAGLAIGGTVGWVIGEAMGTAIPSWIPALLLGAMAALVAALASRLVIAIGLAMVLGLGLPALTWAVADLTGHYELPAVRETPEEVHQDGDDADAEPSDPIGDWLEDWIQRKRGENELPANLDEQAPDLSTFQLTDEQKREFADEYGLSEEQQQQLQIARDFIERLTDAATDIWNQAPEQLKKLLVLTAALGVLLGLVLGVFAAKVATAMVTAFGGAGLWMFGALAIAGGLGAPLESVLPASIALWALAWLVVSGGGLAIQWTATRKRADKSG